VSGSVIPATWPKTLKERWKVTVGVGHASPVLAMERFMYSRDRMKKKCYSVLMRPQAKRFGDRVNQSHTKCTLPQLLIKYEQHLSSLEIPGK
jgi:hypothetical protein